MRTIKIALLGLGTVGTGVYKILNNIQTQLPLRAGANIEISKILVRDINKERFGIDQSLLTDNWQEILDDDSIEIVVEVMGGIEPAHKYISEALKSGKNVVTANKDLLASNGNDLLNTADTNKKDLLFEAAVAGAIPIITPLKQSLAGNNVTEITGIVNGTTNFILTKMTNENMSYEQALSIAKDLGYAEADPTADIEGHDAGRKVAIMASIGFNTSVNFNDVYTEGITKITTNDIKFAGELGYVIKLLGVARNTSTGIEVMVHPMLIDNTHPLASVNDSFNAIYVYGDAIDEAMFMGRGAGELPTGSAVVGDIIDVARNIIYNCNGRIGCTCYKDTRIKAIDEVENKFFMRMEVDDKPGALAEITAIFGNALVGIDRLIQTNKSANTAELVIITDLVLEKNFNDSILKLKGLSLVKEVSSIIRVY